MKKAIITGANGFIGSRLVHILQEKGVETYALVQKDMDYSNITGNIVEFELDNISLVQDNLPFDVDCFYHFAWKGVSSSYKNDYVLQMDNINSSLNAMCLAEYLKCKKIIFPGSVSEYAYSDRPVDGKGNPCPADMYSACKVAVHNICEVYAKQHDLSFIWLLIPSIYGPGRSDNNIITYAIKELLNANKPLFTKLEQLWDYLYIDDLLHALYLIGCNGIGGNIYALGSGDVRPLSQYIEIIRNSIDPDLPFEIGALPYKTKQIDNSIVDLSLLCEHTGFEPQYSFEVGIMKTIEYFKEKLRAEINN